MDDVVEDDKGGARMADGGSCGGAWEGRGMLCDDCTKALTTGLDGFAIIIICRCCSSRRSLDSRIIFRLRRRLQKPTVKHNNAMKVTMAATTPAPASTPLDMRDM